MPLFECVCVSVSAWVFLCICMRDPLNRRRVVSNRIEDTLRACRNIWIRHADIQGFQSRIGICRRKKQTMLHHSFRTQRFSIRHDKSRQTRLQIDWTITPQGCLSYWAVHWTAQYGMCRIGFNSIRQGNRRRIMPCRTEILWNISIRHGIIRPSVPGVRQGGDV